MSDFYSEHQVRKTRNDHKCFGCREKLPKGSTAFYVTGVFEHDFFADYLCNKCKDYLDENSEYAREGYCEGDIGDARRQEEREVKQA